eukprot:Em0015g220a
MYEDVTAEVEAQEVEAQEELVLREQELSNLLLKKDYVNAVGLAISLNQPFRVLTILTEAILKFIVKWNMNAKNTRVAQTDIHLKCLQSLKESSRQWKDWYLTLSAISSVSLASSSWQHLSTTLGNVCESAVKSLLFRMKPTISMGNLNLRHVTARALTLVNTDNTQLKVAADADISLGVMIPMEMAVMVMVMVMVNKSS